MTTSEMEPGTAQKKPARRAGGGGEDPGGREGAGGAPLPARLVEPLQVVAGRARLLAFGKALFSFLTIASVVWLITALVLGSRVQVPRLLAVPMVLATWAVVAYAGWRLFRPVFHRPTIRSAAQLVDTALPDTQERISSAVEIAAEQDPRFRGSPELVACLLRQAEHHAGAMNPAAVISGREVTRWFGALAAMLVVWFLLLVLMTPQVLLGLQRTFAPWLAAASMPGPVLAVTPGDVTLAQGQELTVNVEVKAPEGLSLDSGTEEIPAPTLTQHFTAAAGGIATPDRSEPMERTGPRTFRTSFKAVQAPFTYAVQLDGGAKLGRAKSQAYTVRVQARPGVAQMQLTYTYPEYTRLRPRTEPSREGAIEAVVGTRVRVSVTPTQAVATATLQIDDNGNGPATVALTPAGAVPANVEAAPAGTPAPALPAYEGEFILNKSTQYRIKLATAEGRDNPDANARPITARPDMPPQVSITSPGGTAPVRVRPDDTVPVRFEAGDDFGLTRLEMLLQVDDLPPTAVPLNGALEEARVAGEWPLGLAEVVRIAGGTGEPRRVFYQVRATDNRVPTPQAGLSARQVLELDRGAAPLAQRRESEAVKELAGAVDAATRKLQDAQKKLDELQKAEDKPLSAQEQQKMAQARQEIADARQALNRAADAANATRVGELGRQAREVADEPLRRAEEAAARSALAADQPAAWKASGEQASQEVADALRRLDGLSSTLGDASRTQPLAQKLEQLAQRQRELAEKLARNPNDPDLHRQQRELQQDVEKLIRENPQLQEPAMAAQQQRVDQLAEKLSSIEQSQRAVTEQVRNQASAGTIPERSKDLARRQEELNREIANLQGQQADPLKQVSGRAPPPEQLEPIVRDLQGSRLGTAAQQQRAAASQLGELAGKLETAQRSFEQNAAQRERLAAQAEESAKAAAAAQQAAQRAAQRIADTRSRGAQVMPSNPVNQELQQAAEHVRAAAARQAANPASQEAAKRAEKAAEDAKNSVRRGQAEAAQGQLANAANELAQAAEAAQRAAGVGPAAADQPSIGAAAEKSRELAERQRALADETNTLAKSAEDARNVAANPGATATQQQAIADRLTEAARDAEALSRQTQGTAPQLAERASKAASALQQSAQSQRDAAQATRAASPAQAATRQEQSAEQLAQAEEALTGRPRPRQDAAAERPRDNPPPADRGNRGNEPRPAEQRAGNDNAPAGRQGDNAAQPGGQQAQSGQQGQGGQQAQTGQQGQTGQQAAGNGGQQQNGGNRQGAQNAGAQGAQSDAAGGRGGEQAGRSGGQAAGAGGNSPSANSGGQTASGAGGTPSGNGGNASPGAGGRGGSPSANGSPSAGSPGAGGAPQPGGSPGSTASSAGGQAGAPGAGASGAQGRGGATPGGQRGATAAAGQGSAPGAAAGDSAQSVQSARSAQAEAARGNAAAARQAADNLSEASRRYMSSGPAGNQPGPNGQRDPGDRSANAGQPGPTPGQGQGGAPGAGSSPAGGPGAGGGGGAGTGGTSGATGENPGGGVAAAPAADATPEPVKAIGLSPSEWARLPSKMQEELLHTAQQPMPPAYREQIKNYYSRISRLQAEPR